MRTLSLLSTAALATASTLLAQQPGDSLRLRDVTSAALNADPRQRQIGLQASATDVRIRNILATRLPQISGTGQAQYQSTVTRVAVPIPGIVIPSPSRDTYDAHVNAQESIFDPTLTSKQALERAQLAESQAGVRTSVFSRRQEVNDAFFAAATLEQRIGEIGLAITDLESRLKEAVTRFREGAALPSDTAVVAATLLQRRQDLYQARADRSAAMERLSDLIGRRLTATTTAVVPNLDATVASALGRFGQLRDRPEYGQFSATRERLAKQGELEAAQDKPRVSAFGRLGYGKPGLNMLSSSFDPYWLAGVQVQWSPWNWGTTDRDRQALEIQRQIVATNETAFTESLQRAIRQSVATIAGLDSSLVLDDQIVALRERIEAETRVRLNEGVATAAEYADRSTDVLSARLARIQHRVQRTQAQANLLTTLGVEVPQ
jgi:outer membrane protein TolC